MPRFLLFMEDPFLAAHSLGPHFILWVSCMGPLGFETSTHRNSFTATVLDRSSSPTIEIKRFTGSTLMIRGWEWRRGLSAYIEEMENSDATRPRNVSRNRLTTYLHPMFKVFFGGGHLFGYGQCTCFGQNIKKEPPTDRQLTTTIWDS